MSRVTSSVKRFNSRYKAQIFVDNLPVEQAFFFSEAEAKAWCREREAEKREEVRER